MPLTIVDSDILIDAGRGIDTAINFLKLRESSSDLAICVITQMELTVGCRNKTEQHDLTKFLSRFQILPITADISDRAADLISAYYLSHGLLIADAFIAATALTHADPFATKNHRDYRFIDGLNLLKYPD
jgi:predicted nucleic acid-binding protein